MYSLRTGSGRYIDPCPNPSHCRLLWGAHFANDATHGREDQKIGRHDVVNNAMFDGLYMRATKEIKPGIEILVAYNMTETDKSKVVEV